MSTTHTATGNFLGIGSSADGNLELFLRQDVSIKKSDRPAIRKRSNVTADRCLLLSFSILGPDCPITQLSLRCNSIKKIPMPLFKLQHLRFLDLEYNLIEHIPSDIGYLSKSLTHLYLGHNLISSIPPQLGLLSLQHLTVDDFAKQGPKLGSPHDRWTLQGYAYGPIPQLLVEMIIALDIRSNRFWNINGLLLGGFDDTTDGAVLLLHGGPERILRHQPGVQWSVPSLATFCLHALGPLDSPKLHTQCIHPANRLKQQRKKTSKVLCHSQNCILAALPDSVQDHIEAFYPLVPCLVCGLPSCSDGIQFRSSWLSNSEPDRINIPTDAILCSARCLSQAICNTSSVPFHARRLKSINNAQPSSPG